MPRSLGIPCAVLVLAALAPAAVRSQQTYEIVGTGPVRNDGQPTGRLLASADGSLRGSTWNGGPLSKGSLFALTPDGGGGFTGETLHGFSGPDGKTPMQGLVHGSDGLYYGTTSDGGRGGFGVIWSRDPSGRLTVLHDFADSCYDNPPSELAEGPDGKFYGTCTLAGLGALFRIDRLGQVEIVHSFTGSEGYRPQAGVVLGPDGRLWGTTTSGGASNHGTVYAFDLSSGIVSLVHDFDGADGARPTSSLVVAGGDLFGTTSEGGSHGRGTVFRITTAGVLTTLHSFTGSGDGIQPADGLAVGSDGNLYGSTPFVAFDDPPFPVLFYGTLFRVLPGGGLTTIYTFPNSNTLQGPLVAAPDGNLYGPKGGEILRLATDGTVSTAFVVGADLTPSQSSSNLVEDAAGNLYGIFFGGPSRAILRLDPSSEFSTFFTYDPGDSPNNDLLLGSDGNFYGLTCCDGVASFGTVYRIDSGGTRTILHTFTGLDGSFPAGGLAEGPGLEFFGATGRGGANGHGTLFKVHENGTLTSLHDFDGSDGHEPGSGLALAGDGNFYGTTVEGGDYGLGTAYRIDALGNFASIHSFAGAPDEGQNPWGRLLPGSDGNLYGTTYLAGPADYGTIFRMDTDGNQTTIYSCPVNFFGTSTAALIEVAVGEFYGVAPLFHPYGEVFRVDAGGTVTPVHVFAGGREGSFPSAPLVKTADGALYGTAATVYRLLPQPDPPSLSRLEPSSGRAGGGGSVAVRGHHFREGVAAKFGGVDVAGIYFDRESRLIAIAPPLPAGTLQDVTVTNADASTVTLPGAWFADFLDVPGADGFHDSVEAIFRAGITAGCGGGLYCRNDAVSRAQMAVFILKAKHGAGYTPPSCSGIFGDVSCPSLFADWIEQLAAEGITGGCGANNFCPTDPVRRDQMAVFLLKGEHGSGYAPPACQGVFGDVTCPSLFSDWIEQLAAEQITGGCGNGNYCPHGPNTRGQMAVFLEKTFLAP